MLWLLHLLALAATIANAAKARLRLVILAAARNVIHALALTLALVQRTASAAKLSNFYSFSMKKVDRWFTFFCYIRSEKF